jgi:apolipoprotein N-acyltransferase
MSLPMRLAPWTGVYGLSFVYALLGASLAVASQPGRRRELLWLTAVAGLFLLPDLPAPASGGESLVAVQPNVAMDERWSQPRLDATRDEIAYLSLKSALDPSEPPARMVVWPESPAPFYYESDPRFRSAAASLARAARTHFLFGTVAYTPEGAPLNSAQLLAPTGEPVVRYDKMFLVPFGEFVPPLFGFVNRISKEAGDFVPGRGVVVADVGGRRVGTFICYEAVFPHLVRRFAAAGAVLFVNISNDGYFGDSAARHQHLLIARMRAAENRRWMIRVTNNGITVSIDPAGRLRQMFAADVRMAGRLRYGLERETTFYTRHGDWFAWLCLAAGLGAALAAQIPRYRRP